MPTKIDPYIRPYERREDMRTEAVEPQHAITRHDHREDALAGHKGQEQKEDGSDDALWNNDRSEISIPSLLTFLYDYEAGTNAAEDNQSAPDEAAPTAAPHSEEPHEEPQEEPNEATRVAEAYGANARLSENSARQVMEGPHNMPRSPEAVRLIRDLEYLARHGWETLEIRREEDFLAAIQTSVAKALSEI